MKVKKTILSIILSIICGALCGKLVYNIYQEKITNVFDSTKVYGLQTGAYSSIDSMKKNSDLKNYIYYDDNGLYKTLLAITKDKENIDKIKSAYNVDVVINEYYLENDELNNKIVAYDVLLKEKTKEEEIKGIVLEMLDLYKNNNSVKLVRND